jgi:hypothetical protein
MPCQSCFNAVFGILLENPVAHTGGMSNTTFWFETQRGTDYLEGLMLRFIHSSMALQPFVGPWPLPQFRNLFTLTVGLLGRVINPSQGRHLHTAQHKQNKHTHRRPCLDWDSNPRSHRSSKRRQFMP